MENVNGLEKMSFRDAKRTRARIHTRRDAAITFSRIFVRKVAILTDGHCTLSPALPTKQMISTLDSTNSTIPCDDQGCHKEYQRPGGEDEETTTQISMVSLKHQTLLLEESSSTLVGSCSETSTCSDALDDTCMTAIASLSSMSRRQRCLSFDDNVEVILLPRLVFEEDLDSDDEEDDEVLGKGEVVKKTDLFYQRGEINMWLCEERMRKAGIDPDNFDWRSTR